MASDVNTTTRGLVRLLLLVLIVTGCVEAPPTQAPLAFEPAAGRADWWVDPGRLPLAPDATVISGFLQEQTCASGQSPEGRITGPRVDYRPDAIIVTFHVRAIEGVSTCQSNPRYPVTIHLSEPLGRRGLFDGGVDPPRDATVDPTRVVAPTVDCGPLVGTSDAKGACNGMVDSALGDRYEAFTTVHVRPHEADCPGDLCTGRSAIEARTWIVSATDLGAVTHTWTCTYRDDVAACTVATE